MDTLESNVPLLISHAPSNESLGVGMYTSLMGNFDMSTPIKYLGTMTIGKNICMVVYRTDP